ncbi:class I SAM-dependent methyltransferase [Nocardioides sp.]|uniref:class I SAM-dependent methyltransferase n=1 Tax=Nocardioides sp. TaxID=35761 RepID=UPI003527FB23
MGDAAGGHTGHGHGPRGGHDHGHDHGGHAHDQGVRGALRYLRLLPRLWRSEVNDAVVARIAPRRGERVVDIGAGMGAGAVAAAVTGATVVAVEPTPFMRGLLRSRLTAGRLTGSLPGRSRPGRIELAAGAAEHLPLADGSVDAIWAVNTLHHWNDLERGVAEIGRVLAPGGRVLLVDEVFSDPRHPECERFGGGGGHHDFLEVEAPRLADLLRAAGLEEVDDAVDELAGRPVLAVSGHAPAGERRIT